MADSYMSALNSDALFVPAKAATIHAAHESSLFLGGQLIPVVNAPNGVLQVPELAKATGLVLDTDFTGDVTNAIIADTKNTISCGLYAARSVIRDLGNVDPNEVGRALGNGVSAAFDTAVAGVLGSLTSQDTNDADLNVDDIATAVATIRGNGETGQLYGIISTDSYATLMASIGSTAFAGGDQFQSQVMRSGYFGTIAGVQLFVSSYVNATNTGVTATKAAIFSQDAMRIAMQRNIDLEVARRAEAVGYDAVASLMAGVGLIDASRGVIIANPA